MLFVPLKIFTYIKKLKIEDVLKAEIITQLCRVNTLSTIKIAGSGHLGTSFSAMDLFVWISHFVINKKKKKILIGIFFFHLKAMMFQHFIMFCFHLVLLSLIKF